MMDRSTMMRLNPDAGGIDVETFFNLGRSYFQGLWIMGAVVVIQLR